jgi:hypothetical protein
MNKHESFWIKKHLDGFRALTAQIENIIDGISQVCPDCGNITTGPGAFMHEKNCSVGDEGIAEAVAEQMADWEIAKTCRNPSN